MDITALLNDAKNLKLSAWLFNRTELDVALDGTKRDVFKVYVYSLSGFFL